MLSEIRLSVLAGHHRHSHPAKSLPALRSVAMDSSDDQTHKHVSCTCILEHFVQKGKKSKSALETYILSLPDEKKIAFFVLRT